MEPAQTAAWIERLIREFVSSPENDLGGEGPEPAWGAALVGFSSGADSLYREFRESIGTFYWEPVGLFRETFPDRPVRPEDLTVISWVLPQTEATKRDNGREQQLPSERWARSRKFGEEFNVKLRLHVVRGLAERKVEALAPQLSPHWSMHVSERFGLSSSWSERHAAHASGLGTFGLCDGLITPVGKAMRCGSVIARITLPPTERRYRSRHAYCPFLVNGSCGACIKRCPVGALSEKGHDKERCRVYIEDVTAAHILSNFGLSGTYGCGLCQTKVPCESGIPPFKPGL